MSIRVLLVDDDPDMHLLVRSYLARFGARYALHGEQAFTAGRHALVDGPHDICLLDYDLGQGTGPELLAQARAAGARIPVVMLTGRDDAEADAEAMAAGVVDYLIKSKLDADRLDRTLRYAMERKRNAEVLARGREDLRALLDHQRVGTAVVDADERLTFVSAAAARMLGAERARLVGQRIDTLPRMSAQDRERLAEMGRQPADARQKVAVALRGPYRRALQVEIDVVDDPRDAARRMYFVYDVTEVNDLRQQLDDVPRFHGIIGRSAVMRALFEQIRQLAAFDATVLIEGETGTGKELVGRALHACSKRAPGPYIPVNCAGLTDSLLGSQLFGHRKGAFTGATADHAGVFESADAGSLFLDELGDIPHPVQTRLLRVLQEREITRLGESRPRKVDVRVIAATHRDLAAEVEAGRFRMDLLYRVRVARLRIPPLRERLEDIPLLIDAFLAELRQQSGKPVTHVAHDALGRMLEHDWPGNVRELRGVVESGFIRAHGAAISIDDLPEELTEARATGPVATGGDEASRIRAALEAVGGSRTRAAQLLGISRATFYRRLSALGIDPKRS